MDDASECASPRESVYMFNKVTQLASPISPTNGSSDANPGDNDLKRSPEVWYEDGTVVLQARSTVFRVYRGILSSQSQIFTDLLAISQSDQYDGCPVIQVHDSADEMTFFLKALHDYNYAKKLQNFKVVSALLRLGTKYAVEPLRERAIQTLSLEYPCTRAEYDNRHNRRNYEPQHGDDLLVINLARRFDVPQILPAAFYSAASSYTSVELFEGIEVDGVRKQLVDLRDVRICVSAQTMMVQKAPRWIFLQDSKDIPECHQKTICNGARLRWASSKTFERLEFMGVETSFPWEEWKRDLCSACVQDAVDNCQSVKKTAWDYLPMLFELPPWDVIMSSS